MLKHRDTFDKLKALAFEHLKELDWRAIKDRLSSIEKDSEDTYIWWYSRESKDGKVFHNSNSRFLVEDIEYAPGSGHFNVEITKGNVPEFEVFKELLQSIPELSYAGAFFIGPNSYVEEHTDKDMYSMLITVKSNPESYIVVDNQKHYLKEGEIFTFDGDLVHSASNNSNDDWVMLALRLPKNKYQL